MIFYFSDEHVVYNVIANEPSDIAYTQLYQAVSDMRTHNANFIVGGLAMLLRQHYAAELASSC